MKVIIIGKTTRKLAYVKFVKEVTGLGLKESKELVDNSEFAEKLTLDVDYEKTLQLFKESDLENSGLILKKHRKEIINKFLMENDPDFDISSDPEYNKCLDTFNFLFRTNKENLKESLNETIENLKNIIDALKV